MANATIVAGLGYGDEGKGALVSFLTGHLKAKLVVRFNGGPQAAHNVVDPEGRHHTFAQFGSGTLSGCPTLISRLALFSPGPMLAEAEGLRALGVSDPMSLMRIEQGALAVTPYHAAMNRIRETRRGKARHGSCGMGIFEAVKDSIDRPDVSIKAVDLSSPRLRDKLDSLRRHKLEQAEALEGEDSEEAQTSLALLRESESAKWIAEDWATFGRTAQIVDRSWLAEQLWQPGEVLFEGAQGILLDEDWGFFPYATRSKTGFVNALELLGDCTGKATRIGVLRSHMTRHGAGPFVTEDPEAAFCARGDHNKFGLWQQNFRVGWLDLVALSYAARAMREIGCGPDLLAMSHMDRPNGTVCWAYEWPAWPGGLPDPDLFEADGRLVRSIRIKPTNLARQEILTKALLQIKQPVLGYCGQEQELLRIVEEKLEAPVKIVGRGQSWKDWEELP